jgi:predicted enzyme related to lactoylglutathione lyase
MDSNHPTFGNGKICYLELPSTDIGQSSEFYRKTFGWQVRQHDDGTPAFDDGVGEVSGTWVTSRKAQKHPGMLIHIMVDDMQKTLDLIGQNGGTIVQPVGKDYPEITAKFRDPSGNLMGLYQHGGAK